MRQQNQQQRPRLSEFQRFQRDLRQRAPITRDENQQQRPKFSEFQSIKRDLTQQAPITQQQRPRFSEFESFKRDLRQQAPITRKRDESLERLCKERPMEAARMFNIESINQQVCSLWLTQWGQGHHYKVSCGGTNLCGSLWFELCRNVTPQRAVQM